MAESMATFEPGYGEPAWRSRPYVDEAGDHAVTPTNDRSYEENRLMRQGLHRDSRSDKDSDTYSGWNRSLPLIDRFLSKHQAIYLRWSQSAYVHILVGQDEDTFYLPSDFLTRRSIVFRVMLESQFGEASTRIIRLPETSKETFQQIVIWMLSPQYSKEQTWSFSTTVDVAIFATIYIVPSLLHQSLDILREIMSGADNPWTPEVLDRIYSQADESSMLRAMTRVAIAHLGRGWSGFSVKHYWLTRWQEVFEQHAALGVDYFTVQVKNWRAEDLMLGGPCRFHQHDQRIPLAPVDHEGVCPYMCNEYFEEVSASQKSKSFKDDRVQIKKQEYEHIL